MIRVTKKILIFLSITPLVIATFLGFISATPVFAYTAPTTDTDTKNDSYQLLEPTILGGQTAINFNEASGGFVGYAGTIFKYLLYFLIVLAIVLIVINGIKYGLSESVTSKDNAKKGIQRIVGGLILVLSCWLILNTINPDILKWKLDIAASTAASSPTGGGTGNGSTDHPYNGGNGSNSGQSNGNGNYYGGANTTPPAGYKVYSGGVAPGTGNFAKANSPALAIDRNGGVGSGIIENGAAYQNVKGTGYSPNEGTIGGGPIDPRQNKIRTLQQYLAGQADYVSVAMDLDSKAQYGQEISIPELDAAYNGGQHIPFRVVDNGGKFNHKTGTSALDIATDVSRMEDQAINGVPLTVIVGAPPPNNWKPN